MSWSAYLTRFTFYCETRADCRSIRGSWRILSWYLGPRLLSSRASKTPQRSKVSSSALSKMYWEIEWEIVCICRLQTKSHTRRCRSCSVLCMARGEVERRRSVDRESGCWSAREVSLVRRLYKYIGMPMLTARFSEGDLYRGLSFTTISATGPNGGE